MVSGFSKGLRSDLKLYSYCLETLSLEITSLDIVKKD